MLTLPVLLGRCEVATAGIDGGGLDDLLALAIIGRERVTRRWLLWCHAWAHPIVMERRKEIAPLLKDFEDEGDLTIVTRLGEDVTGIVDLVEQVDATGLLPAKNAIGLDPVGIGQIVDELATRKIAPEGTERLAGIPQGWKLSGAIDTLERKIADGTLVHAGSRMMAWAVGNARVEPRGNAKMITKQTAGRAKIDPLMAAFNAAAVMSMNPEARGRSVYELLAAQEAQAAADQAAAGGDQTSIDYAVLQDMRHPMFATMKARFEAWQQDQLEGVY